MRINKRRTTIFIILIVALTFILMSIFNNNHTVDTSDMLINKPWEREIRIVNSDYMKQYIYSITGFYKELPWAVRTSYIIIQLSSLALIVLLYILFWDVHNRKNKQRKYQNFKNLYFEKLINICNSETVINEKRIINELNSEESNFTYSDKLLLIDMFLELRMQIKITETSIANIQNSIKAFNLQDFMEQRLVSGADSEKLKIIQAIRLLHMNVTDSYVTRIINHRDKNLQKAARLYYVLSNDEDPFRYMEGNNSNSIFLKWDMLETHQIFEDCKNLNKKLPSFIPAIEQENNNSIVEFFIRETAYWGSEKEMNYLIKLLESKETPIRKAVIESIDLRKTSTAENNIKDIYYEQPENIKRVILYTLLAISPSTSIIFFKEAFENTSSQLTKRMALQCLLKSGDEGKRIFKILKERSNQKENILFLHVEDKIINREVLNIHNIN